ncbi:MAG TPA: hypothetical protein V6C95_03400 [Coleofasciculaceae cyanobacterium]
MSSVPPGRYQSRLFNFLNRQSIRFVEQCDRTVRHLKVAATWGVQILLYPIYLAVQTGLTTGRQLASSAQAGWPQFKQLNSSEPQEVPPTVDTPIQQVLGELAGWQVGRLERCEVGTLEGLEGSQVGRLEGSNALSEVQPGTPVAVNETTQELTPEKRVIQGVATLLSTRSLVLVAVGNQILDILTPQQQQKLSSRIIWEVANFLYQRHTAQALESKPTPRLLSTLDQPRVLLPVRIFWQVMAWVQTSPVAIATNLFQESSLVYSAEPTANLLRTGYSKAEPNSLEPLPFYPPIPIQDALAFLDRIVAELESGQIVPGTQAAIALGERLQQLKRQFTPPADQITSPEASQSNTFKLQSLIYAAIHYFFGKRGSGSNLPQADSQEQLTISANPQAPTQQLSGRNSSTLSPQLQGNSAKSPAQLPEADESRTSTKPGYSIWGKLKHYLNRQPSPGKLSKPDSKSALPTNPSTTSSSTTVSSNKTNASTLTETSDAHGFQIQALIYAAIDYFFGRRNTDLPQTSSQNQSAIPASLHKDVHQLSGRNSTVLPPGTQLTDGMESDPWLTLDDLFGNAETSELNSTTTAPLEQKHPASKTQLPESFTSKIPRVRKPLIWIGQKTSSPQVQNQRKTTALTKQQTSTSPTVDSGNTSISTKKQVTSVTATSSPNTDLEPAPDWIETKVTPVGYVRHPLELLLSWLDHAMLQLEEFAIKLWQWVRHLRG